MSAKEILDQIKSDIPKPQPLERKEIKIPDEVHDKIMHGVIESIKGVREMKPTIVNCIMDESSLSHKQWGDFVNELHQLFKKYGVVEMQNADVGPLSIYEKDGWGISNARILLRQREELLPGKITEGMSEDE